MPKDIFQEIDESIYSDTEKDIIFFTIGCMMENGEMLDIFYRKYKKHESWRKTCREMKISRNKYFRNVYKIRFIYAGIEGDIIDSAVKVDRKRRKDIK